MKNNIGKLAWEYLQTIKHRWASANEYDEHCDFSYVREAMDHGFKPYMLVVTEPLHIKI